MVNEERLVGQGSDRWQYFLFADALMIKKLGFVLLMPEPLSDFVWTTAPESVTTSVL